MPVQPNATFRFDSPDGHTPAYEVQDYPISGVLMHFVCPAPGPGQPTGYDIFLTDAELAAITTANQLRTLVETKLNRKIRATGIASKLDAFIGQSVGPL